jgi:hypothetical protein
MTVTPTDVYAFGNRLGPRLPRSNQDVFPDSAGMVGPESGPPWRGPSTFANPLLAPLTGHYHRLPKGTPLPDGLGIVADGCDVDSTSPLLATHHTVYPTLRMPLDQFIELFRNLPWEYAGKK